MNNTVETLDETCETTGGHGTCPAQGIMTCMTTEKAVQSLEQGSSYILAPITWLLLEEASESQVRMGNHKEGNTCTAVNR